MIKEKPIKVTGFPANNLLGIDNFRLGPNAATGSEHTQGYSHVDPVVGLRSYHRLWVLWLHFIFPSGFVYLLWGNKLQSL